MPIHVPVENASTLEANAFEPLQASLGQLTSMERALAWFRTHEPPLHPADLIQQDEFTFDLLVPYPESLWLSFAIN